MTAPPPWHALAAATYARTGSLRAAAAELGVTKPRVWQVLRRQGVVLGRRGAAADARRGGGGRFAAEDE